MRRLAIAFFFDKDGIVDEYMLHLLRAFKEYIETTIFVVNGQLNKNSQLSLAGLADNVVVRSNEGFDVWAYKEGLERIGFDSLAAYDEVVLYNHTFYGPLFPLSEMFAEMEARKCDFWGITAHKKVEPNPFTGDGVLPFHLNSHFIAIRRQMASSPSFRQYWQNVPDIHSYEDSILLHESRFTDHFTKLGFQVGVYMDPDSFTSNYPLFEEVDAAIDSRCPILKRRSLFADPIMMDQKAIDLPRAITYIKNNSDYDVSLIWKNILREAELRVLHTNAALMSVYPHVRLRNVTRDYGRVAVCVHVYYVDMIDELLDLCRNMPCKFDFIATTDTAEKHDLIKAKVKESKMPLMENVFIRIVDKNIGADTTALLITCRDLILNGGYQLICRLHSKRSVQDTGGRGRYFKRHLFENVIGSPGYVANILDMFFENPLIGLAIPPAIHVHYSTMGHGWFNNRRRTETVAEHVGIKVKFDPDTPIAPFGGMFWFRPKALRKLFEYPWKWSDFEHDKTYRDGDLPHAIERVYAYVAQDAKYLTHTVAASEQAEQNYVRLEYKAQKFASLLPAGDFAYHCYLLKRWKEAGHPLSPLCKLDGPLRQQIEAETNVRSIGQALKRLVPRKAIVTHIDNFNDKSAEEQPKPSLKRKDHKYLSIAGWAIPASSNQPFEHIVIELRGAHTTLSMPATIIPRPDVAHHFGKPTLEQSGFKWAWPMELLGAGAYAVKITGIDARGWHNSRRAGEFVLE